MNVILVTPEEAAADPVTLTDERAAHIREVLRGKFGHEVRVGVIDGPLGTATIEDIDDGQVTLACRFEDEVPVLGPHTLLLAVPRPVVLRRCLAAAASLGFGKIVLFRSWRVDKSHLDANVFDEQVIRAQLLSGLSQARRTRLPEVLFYPLFKPFLEDHLDALVAHTNRFVAHPEAKQTTAAASVDPHMPYTLAIGPERGFIEYEVKAFQMLGFAPIQASSHPLRVETALAYFAGQLDLVWQTS